MNRSNSGNEKLLPRIGKLLGILLLILSILYGGWMLILNGMLTSDLNAAKKNYTAVPVRIVEIRPQEHNPLWNIVTLEKADLDDKSVAQEILLGKTRANAVKFNLSVGKKLTMYYDPQFPDIRIVDFENTGILLLLGILMTCLPLLLILVLLLCKFLRKPRKQPVVQIATDDHKITP